METFASRANLFRCARIFFYKLRSISLAIRRHRREEAGRCATRASASEIFRLRECRSLYRHGASDVTFVFITERERLVVSSGRYRLRNVFTSLRKIKISRFFPSLCLSPFFPSFLLLSFENRETRGHSLRVFRELFKRTLPDIKISCTKMGRERAAVYFSLIFPIIRFSTLELPI